MKRYAIDFHLEDCIAAEDVESKFPLKRRYVLFEGF
jgi:hypothetical protein